MRALRSNILTIVIATLAPVAVFGMLYMYATSHAVLPGLNGCQYVRSQEPRIDCYASAIADMVKRDGVQATMATIDRDAKRVARLGEACHLAWHPTGERYGRAAAGRDGDVKMQDGQGSFCSEGFVHGYYLGYLAARGGSSVGPKELSSICGGTDNGDVALQCVHAFGHQLARQSSKVDVGGRACQGARVPAAANGTPRGQQGVTEECLYGMWMEYSMKDVAKGSSAQLNNCSTSIDVSELVCFRFLPFRIDRLTGDRSRAANSCGTYAPKGEMHATCVMAFASKFANPEQCSIYRTAGDRKLCRSSRSTPMAAVEG